MLTLTVGICIVFIIKELQVSSENTLYAKDVAWLFKNVDILLVDLNKRDMELLRISVPPHAVTQIFGISSFSF